MTTRPLVGFVRELRDAGIPVGPTAAGELMAAAELVGLSDAHDVYHAFRALTVTSVEQIPTFNEVFIRFFGTDDSHVVTITTPAPPRTWSIHHARDEGAEGEGEEPSEEEAFVGASARERLATRDFATLTPEEEAEVRTLIARMVWHPALTWSRRRRPSRVGDRPDLRRTLRGSVGPEGDLLRVATTERRIRRRPLIFIADVSGSMERYAEMLLYFAHAARGRLGRLEAFVFSTRLTRITRQLERRDPSSAIAEVAEAVTDWSGGTQIGEAIRTFNVEWSRRVGRGSPIALIVSDGWDRGDPGLLASEMARLHRSVHRVVWLNPLAGRPGYAPETRGMRAALPHVDDFLPAANLTDLATLIELLESVPARRIA